MLTCKSFFGPVCVVIVLPARRRLWWLGDVGVELLAVDLLAVREDQEVVLAGVWERGRRDVKHQDRLVDPLGEFYRHLRHAGNHRLLAQVAQLDGEGVTADPINQLEVNAKWDRGAGELPEKEAVENADQADLARAGLHDRIVAQEDGLAPRRGLLPFLLLAS